MAEIKIVYKELEELADHARKVGEKCEDYEDELKRKLSDKIQQLPESPLSSNASHMGTANTYIKAKRTALTNKKTNYKNFANSVDELLRNTKVADKAVSKQVNNSKKDFLKDHPNLEGDGWAAFFAAISVEVPIIGWIIDSVRSKYENRRDLWNTIRRWYEVSGGKKVVDTVLAVAGVALAVVGLVISAIAVAGAAGVSAFIFATVGLVSAVIGVINAVTDFVTQIKANTCKDPAWSKYYGDQNSLATVLRKKTFRGGAAFFNKASMHIATALEVTETICAVVGIAEGIDKLFKSAKSTNLKKFKDMWYKEVNTNPNARLKTPLGNTIDDPVFEFDFSKFKESIKTKEGRSNVFKTLKNSLKDKSSRNEILWGNKDGFKAAITKDFTEASSAWNKVKTYNFNTWKSSNVKDKAEALNNISKFAKGAKRVTTIGTSTTKLGQTFYNGTTYGFDVKKDSINSIKQVTDILGFSGITKTGVSTINTGYKTKKYVANW